MSLYFPNEITCVSIKLRALTISSRSLISPLVILFNSNGIRLQLYEMRMILNSPLHLVKYHVIGIFKINLKFIQSQGFLFYFLTN